MEHVQSPAPPAVEQSTQTRRRSFSWERILPVAILSPTLLSSLVFVYVFIVATFLISISKWSTLKVDWTVRQPLFATYLDMIKMPRFQADLRNTLIFTVLFLICAVGGGLLLAIVLENSGKVSVFFRNVILFPYALSFIVTGVAWRWIFNPETGINILYENPKELGADRICNAVAAYAQYGSPCIFIDFGTATSFGALSGNGNFLGGCILTGVRLAREAVVTGTSKLPHFELNLPEKVINRTTITNLQAGLLYGYVGQVSYLVERMKQEMGEKHVTVVATGGFASAIARQSDAIEHVDSLLTLKGVRMIYEKNYQ